jgi:hypothetical protein
MLTTSQTRDQRVVVLVTNAELACLDELAIANGMARGAYIRHRCLYEQQQPVGALAEASAPASRSPR